MLEGWRSKPTLCRFITFPFQLNSNIISLDYFGVSNANFEAKDANTNPNYRGFPTFAWDELIFLVVMN